MRGINEIVKKIAEGKIAYPEKEADAKDLDWTLYPNFNKVFLKHLVKEEDTDKLLSCHLVKMEVYCDTI